VIATTFVTVHHVCDGTP